MTTGRPKCKRITGSGEKLRRALALNNLTWGGILLPAATSRIMPNGKNQTCHAVITLSSPTLLTEFLKTELLTTQIFLVSIPTCF